MRVLVDTSAWVDFLNGHASSQGDAVGKLLAGDLDVCTCGVVIAEVFQGLREPKSRRFVERRFRDLTFLEATGVDTYFRGAEMFRELRSKGITVRSTIDCLIVALAEENRCSILAKDRDVRTIVASGVARVDEWPNRTP